MGTFNYSKGFDSELSGAQGGTGNIAGGAIYRDTLPGYRCRDESGKRLAERKCQLEYFAGRSFAYRVA